MWGVRESLGSKHGARAQGAYFDAPVLQPHSKTSSSSGGRLALSSAATIAWLASSRSEQLEAHLAIARMPLAKDHSPSFAKGETPPDYSSSLAGDVAQRNLRG